ncbi:hypothetical protein PNEG_03435 [Pneumocystis murina B123]|uniref:Uncharacterized protein n=1 Tax=Pneumocystis murina (strain B123) TaxID=1069680 RepID=M7P382_PNEMU|nr:hypothetical protein PNEG_03435 [Pneumocystis murina B123]EMR08270.1 hypothetical protein PNEG_03435 [Pneumocystis murina B123]
MKIILFFLFTFITYVLSGTFGFAALMPPYNLSNPELEFKKDLVSGAYSFDELLIFLTNGNTHSCSEHLSNACKELTRVYGDLSRVGDAVKSICEHQHEACQKLPEVKKELCETEDVTYTDGLEKTSPLDSYQCLYSYTKCRLRSRGCSYEYMKECRTLLYACQRSYNEYKLYTLFTNLISDDYYSESFQEKLKVLCRDLFNTSDLLVQLCLNPDLLVSELGKFDFLRKEGRGGFFLYPKMSAGALLDTQKLDGGLFLPRTDPSVNPAYFMGYLLGQQGFTKIMFDCMKIGHKCLGLGFFPQSAYFCDARSDAHWDVPCLKASLLLLDEEVPNLENKLHREIWKERYPESVFWTGINVDLCTQLLRPCSYLKRLDPKLFRLCTLLEGHCAHGLEVGSSLSVFERYLRGINSGHDSNSRFDLCQKEIPQVCTSILNTTVDFLTFCLRPLHTCLALEELVQLRCTEIKKEMTDTDPTEQQCTDQLLGASVYRVQCPLSEEYLKFLTTCYTSYPKNQYLKELAGSILKDLTSQEDKSRKLNDGSGKPNDEVFGKPNDEVFGKPNDEVSGKPNDEESGKPNDEVFGKPNDEVSGKPNDEVFGRPNDEVFGKPNDEVSGKPNDEVSGKPNDEESGKPNDEVFGKPNDEVFGKPNDEVFGKPNDEVSGKPNDEESGKPNDEVFGKPNDEVFGRPNDEVFGKPNDEVFGKPNDEVFGKPNDEVFGKPNDEVFGKPNDEESGKPNDDDGGF